MVIKYCNLNILWREAYLLLFLILIPLFASAAYNNVNDLILPMPPNEKGRTEELWVYFTQPVPSTSTYYIFHEESSGGIEVEVTSSSIKLVNLLNSSMAATYNYAMKPQVWTHIAVSTNMSETRFDFMLYVNGFRISTATGYVEIENNMKTQGSKRYLLSFSDANFPWHKYLYFRNYRLWSFSISDANVTRVMTSNSMTAFDQFTALAFYRFSDAESIQQDITPTGTYYWSTPSMSALPKADFLRASNELDSQIMFPSYDLEPIQIEDLLLIKETPDKTGPILRLPTATLNESTSVTVEFWMAFEKLIGSNLTLIGMSGKPWYIGFGVGGILNSSYATLGCMMDNFTIKCTSASCPCASNTQLCRSFTPATRVWHHFACSRSGKRNASIVLDNVGAIIENTVDYNSSMETLFSPGYMVLGPKTNTTTKEATFYGYIRELRIYNAWLKPQYIIDRMYKTLNPKEESHLLAYFPLTGGKNGDLLDLAASENIDASADSSNWYDRSVYANGSFSWEKNPAMWGLSICRPGYLYHTQSGQCKKIRPKVAFYADQVSYMLSLGDQKGALTNWNSSFSFWVFFNNFNDGAIFLEINNFTSIGLKYTDGSPPTIKYTVTYGKTLETGKSFNIAVDVSAPSKAPALKKWIHIAVLSTIKSDADPKITQVYIDGITPPLTQNPTGLLSSIGTSPPNLPTNLEVYFGYKLQGYIREAKIWTRVLSEEEVLNEKNYRLNAQDSTVLLYLKLNEGPGDYFLDSSSSKPINFYSTRRIEFGAMWKYIDTELPEPCPKEAQQVEKANRGKIICKFYPRVPRSNGLMSISGIMIKMNNPITLEFWMHPINIISKTHYMNITKGAVASESYIMGLYTNNASGYRDLFLNTTTKDVKINTSSAYYPYWNLVTITIGTFSSQMNVFLNGSAAIAYDAVIGDATPTNFYFNLQLSTFRELKIYYYMKTLAEINEMMFVQANPKKENLLHYYPLTFRSVTNVIYDEAVTSSPLDLQVPSLRWVGNEAATHLLCPLGTYYNTLIDTQGRVSQCLEESALQITSSPLVFPGGSGESIQQTQAASNAELIGLAVWVYCSSIQSGNMIQIQQVPAGTPSDYIIISMGLDGSISLKHDADTTTSKPIALKKWIHLGIIASKNDFTIYFNGLVATMAKHATPLASIPSNFQIQVITGVGIFYYKYLQLWSSKNPSPINMLDKMERFYLPNRTSETGDDVLAFLSFVNRGAHKYNDYSFKGYYQNGDTDVKSKDISCSGIFDDDSSNGIIADTGKPLLFIMLSYLIVPTSSQMSIFYQSLASTSIASNPGVMTANPPITIDFWIYLDSVTASTGKVDIVIGDYIVLTLSDSYNPTNYAETMQLKIWQHYAIVILQTKVTVYLNGNSVKETTIIPSTISYSSSSSLWKFTLTNAKISLKQVRVWKKQLTTDQIKLYGKMKSAITPVSSDVTATFSFDPIAFYPINASPTWSSNFTVYFASSAGVYPYVDIPNTITESSGYTSDSPLPCDVDMHFTGTRCVKTKFLYIGRISTGDTYKKTPGVIIPIKSRYTSGMEWTIEAWVYIIYASPISPKTAIFSIEGPRTRLAASVESSTLTLRWTYGLSGNTLSLAASTFSTGSWHYVALSSRLEYPFYVAELLQDDLYNGISKMISPNVKEAYTFFVLGMATDNKGYLGAIALKEVKLWNVGNIRENLLMKMRRQAKTNDANLLYYFKCDSQDETNKDEIIDSSFEGENTVMRLYATPHNYSSIPVTSDDTDITSPTIYEAGKYSVPPLIICDENWFYTTSTNIAHCERDKEEGKQTLLLANSQFSLPLSNYAVDQDWTFEFWLYIREIAGSDTYILKQDCIPEKSGQIYLKRNGTNNELIFYFSQSTEALTIPYEKQKWVHYAFINSAYQQKLSYALNGVINSAEIKGTITGIRKCSMMVGEYSTIRLIYGQLRELRIWNETRSEADIFRRMHRYIAISEDSRLVFYLPITEGYGSVLNEAINSSNTISLNSMASYKDVWQPQGTLHICKEPYVYSSDENLCLSGPKPRLFTAGDTNSIIEFNYDTIPSEAECIQFWIRFYSVYSVTSVEIMSQENHFKLIINSANSNKMEVTLEDNGGSSQVISSSNPPPYSEGWIFIAISNSKISFPILFVNSDLAFGANTIREFKAFNGKKLRLTGSWIGTPTTGTKLIFGLKDIAIYSHLRTRAEIISQMMAKPTTKDPALSFYAPLDESSGSTVRDLCSTNPVTGISSTNWRSSHDIKAKTSMASIKQRDAISLVLQQDTGSSEISIPLGDMEFDGEFTYSVWVKVNNLGRFSFSVTRTDVLGGSLVNPKNAFVIKFDPSDPQTQVEAFILNQKFYGQTKQKFLTSDTWISYTLVKSPKDVRTYVNGDGGNSPSDTDMQGGGVPIDPTAFKTTTTCHCIKIKKLDKPFSLYIKEMRLMNFALSDAEAKTWQFMKHDPWAFTGYSQFYYKWNEWSTTSTSGTSYLIYDTAVMTQNDIYKKSQAIDRSFNAESYFTYSAINKPTICEHYEIWSSSLLRCVDKRKALFFIRGVTGTIDLKSDLLQQSLTVDFTIELWIKMAKSETSPQQILSGTYFKLYYLPSGCYSVIFNNGTDINVTSSIVSALHQWNHVAITNGEIMSKSSIYINGIETGTNSFLKIRTEAMKAYKVNSDTNGFTGMIREVRFWNEHRSPGITSLYMHQYQWHQNSNNYNLNGYYRLDEAQGTTLYGYAPKENITSSIFVPTESTLLSPTWANSRDLPVICSLSQIYDFSKNQCRTTKRALAVGTTSYKFPISYAGPLRDWAFYAWVYFDSNTAKIGIENLFEVQIKDSKHLTLVAFKDKTFSTTMQATTSPDVSVDSSATITVTGIWLTVSVTYTYRDNTILFQIANPLTAYSLNDLLQGTLTPFSCTYVGKTSFVVQESKVMHLSLFKKFLPMAKPNIAGNQAIEPIFLPGLHPDLIAYYPLEESSGSLLHDISFYGSPNQLAADFGSKLNWWIDSDIKGRLLCSKHYMTSIAVDSYFCQSKNCPDNCRYCSTDNYCLSCIDGVYIKDGTCVSSSPGNDGFERDLIESEYKRVPTTTFCNGTMLCKSCVGSPDIKCNANTPSNCLRNAFDYKTVTNDHICYDKCPIGTYAKTSAETCEDCQTSNCAICDIGPLFTCSKCKDTFLLKSDKTCVDISTSCGNGQLDDPEECDDGNTISGDGCSNYCQVETNFKCMSNSVSAPSICTPICGKGIFYGINGQECDDGNTSPNDGCDSNCKIESNYWCNNVIGKKSTCYCSPRYVSASFDLTSGNYDTVKFKFSRVISSLNNPKNAQDLCVTLFSPDTIKLFGNNYGCKFNADTLEVFLGDKNTVYGGNVFVINSNSLAGPGCNLGYTGSVIVPIIPTVSVSGDFVIPSSIQSCQSLTISIINLAGALNRDYMIMSLSLASLIGSVDDQSKIAHKELINYYLAQITTKGAGIYSVSLNANILLPGMTYNIKLTLMNFKSQTFTLTKTLTVLNSEIPSLSIPIIPSNGTLLTQVSQKIIIRSVPSVTRCDSEFSNLTNIAINYTQEKSDTDLLNLPSLPTPSSDRMLIIPAMTLKPGYKYNFVVSSINKALNSTILSKKFTLVAVSGALVAQISPRSATITENDMVLIDGSSSYDPDNTNETMTYTWSCYQTSDYSKRCKFANSSDVPDYSGIQLSVSASLFTPSIASFLWVLTIAKPQRTSQAEAKINIVSSGSPSLIIDGPTTKLFDANSEFVLTTLLNNTSIGNCTFTWGITGCINGTACFEGLTLKMDIIKVITSKITNTGGAITASVRVSDLITSKQSSAEYQFMIDPLPTVGTFGVSPVSGIAWTTNFSFSAQGFNHPNGDLDYQYFIKKSADTYIPISIKLRNINTYMTQLPPSSNQTSNEMVIAIRVSSAAASSYVQVEQTIVCAMYSDSSEIINMTKLSMYQKLKSFGDKDDLLSQMSQVLVGSLLLTDSSSTFITPNTLCNNKGDYIAGEGCKCYKGYRKRKDCSLSDNDYADQKNVAEAIINDCDKLNTYEPNSKQKQEILFMTVSGVAAKTDLIESVLIRSKARDIIEQVLQTPELKIKPNDIITVADNIGNISSNTLINDTIKQYGQLKNIIKNYFDTVSVKTVIGNETVVSDLTNFKVTSGLMRGTQNVILNTPSVSFPPSGILLNDSDKYYQVNIIEWKQKEAYQWLERSPKSRVISIEITEATKLKTQSYVVPKVSLNNTNSTNSTNATNSTTSATSTTSTTSGKIYYSQPIYFKLQLDLNSLNGSELTHMKCLYFDNKTNSLQMEGLHLVNISLNESYAFCASTHLCDFAMGIPEPAGPKVPPMGGDIDLWGIASRLYDLQTAPVFWTSVFVTVLIPLLLIWAYFKERDEEASDKARKIDLYREAANVSVNAIDKSETIMNLDKGSPDKETGANNNLKQMAIENPGLYPKPLPEVPDSPMLPEAPYQRNTNKAWEPGKQETENTPGGITKVEDFSHNEERAENKKEEQKKEEKKDENTLSRDTFDRYATPEGEEGATKNKGLKGKRHYKESKQVDDSKVTEPKVELSLNKSEVEGTPLPVVPQNFRASLPGVNTKNNNDKPGDIGLGKLLLMMHEYIGIYFNISDRLSRYKRIFLLLTKIHFMSLIASLFYITACSKEYYYWLSYAITASVSAQILIVVLRYLIRYSIDSSTIHDESNPLAPNIINTPIKKGRIMVNIGYTLLAITALVSLVFSNLIASARGNNDSWNILFTDIIAVGIDVFIIQLFIFIFHIVALKFVPINENPTGLKKLISMMVTEEARDILKKYQLK